jgi:hypothetical protein
LGVETANASCFTSLAADQQQRPLACPTSPVKTRVRGFCRSASGRFSSRSRRTHRIATGSEPCVYKTASGRGKWPNRDPLSDFATVILRVSMAPGRSRLIRLIIGRTEPNLYEFATENPISHIDPDGREVMIYGTAGGEPTCWSPVGGRPPGGVPYPTPPWPGWACRALCWGLGGAGATASGTVGGGFLFGALSSICSDLCPP